MKRYQKIGISAMVILWMGSLPLFAHEGHDHGPAEKAAGETLLMSKTEAHNDKYEVLLKFTPVEPGDTLQMQLYLSDYVTNKPITAQLVMLENLLLSEHFFHMWTTEPGIYHIKTIMPEEILYDHRVKAMIEGQEYVFELKEVDFAHHHVGGATAHEHNHFWLYMGGAGVLLLGLLLGRYTAIRKYNRQSASLILLLVLPLVHMDQASAHEGHDEALVKPVARSGNRFELAKESQFLMQVYTQFLGQSDYQDGRKLYGTIIPAAGGHSRLVLPQHGRIAQLHVAPGQSVAAGAVVATLERSVDPANELLMAAERNRLTEEVKRLELEMKRLRAVGDIVSKKDLEAVEAQYAIASSNLELYASNGKSMIIKAPISGIVSPFTYQVGDYVSGGTELMTISNIARVYVETQAFEKDVAMIGSSSHFLAQCADGNHATDRVRLMSLGSEFNMANQSQKVLFEVDNSAGDFKLGEFVNVWTYLPEQSTVLAVPNSAITELQGRPVVFVKHAAEQLEMRYVALGRNNGQMTIIENGLKTGERYITEGAYQCKLVYLNQ